MAPQAWLAKCTRMTTLRGTKHPSNLELEVRLHPVVHEPAAHLLQPSLPHRLPAAHLPKHHHVKAPHGTAPHVTATHLRLVVLLHRLRHSHQGTSSTLVVLATGQYRLCQMVAVLKSFQ